MNQSKYKHLLYAIVIFTLATIAGLWSWNTLSGLFGLPDAQYRHVLAAMCMLIILKWVITPHRELTWRLTGGRDEAAHH